MSWLTLVRHAQASFHADHYDQLSPLGLKQARALGESWVRAERRVDEVYIGPRDRQRQTAELVASSFQTAGISFPDPVVIPELDEYDLSGLLLRLAPQLVNQNAEFATLWAGVRNGSTELEKERSFQNMFEPLMFHWLSMDTIMDGLESWLSFGSRVERALQRMTQPAGRGRHIVAFTSGGFIGTAVQRVLGAPDRMALELNWRVRNAAVTDFIFSSERMTLDAFNSTAHFTDPGFITYR
jgi:broad specificity phosphatase PhoE